MLFSGHKKLGRYQSFDGAARDVTCNSYQSRPVTSAVNSDKQPAEVSEHYCPKLSRVSEPPRSIDWMVSIPF